MKSKLFLVLFFAILILPLSLAVPPVQSTVVAEKGLEIQATNFKYLKQNEHHVFRFRVYNASTNAYIHPDNLTCSFGLLNDLGEFIYNKPDVSSTGYIFAVNLTKGNFSNVGIYHTGINCLLDTGLEGGVLPQSLEVTPSGTELTVGKAQLSLGMLFILIFFFLVTLFGMGKLPERKEVKDTGEIINRGWVTYLRPVLFMLSYGLLMAIFYYGSGISLNYLFFTALGDFFFVLYKIMMLMLLPMIIVWLVWIFVSIFQDKEMKKMIERGGDDFGSI